MFQDEVEKVELPAIEQLTRLGWTYVPGADLAPVLPINGGTNGRGGANQNAGLSKRLKAATRWAFMSQSVRSPQSGFQSPNRYPPRHLEHQY